MSKHACPRCGFESSRDRWHDRHPFAAVLLALPTLYTIVGVILAYPWFFIPLLIIAAALWLERQRRRRAAIAARADYDYRKQMVRAMKLLPTPPLSAPMPQLPRRGGIVRTPPPPPHHILNTCPTAPMRTRLLPPNQERNRTR